MGVIVSLENNWILPQFSLVGTFGTLFNGSNEVSLKGNSDAGSQSALLADTAISLPSVVMAILSDPNSASASSSTFCDIIDLKSKFPESFN